MVCYILRKTKCFKHARFIITRLNKAKCTKKREIVAKLNKTVSFNFFLIDNCRNCL